MSAIKEATLNQFEVCLKEVKENLNTIDYASLSHEDKTKLAQSMGSIQFVIDNLKYLK